MGLDMYLRAKTTKRDYQGATGACSGLFSLAPKDSGMVEIGYWRKAYDQNELIMQNISAGHDYGNCENSLLKKEEVEKILKEAKNILATHKFDEEDGTDISDGYDGIYTWLSRKKWEDTIEFFTEAKKILEEDPEAEIYYCTWA